MRDPVELDGKETKGRAARAGRGLVVASLLLLTLGGLSGCRLSKNFYVIDEGKLYRSAQLTGEEFDEAISEYGVKTIVNLRGAYPNEEWYVEERAVAEKRGVELVDLSMRANRLPHRKDLVTLLDTYRDAKKPILIHCRAGADRTGEAAAIYLLEYMGATKEQALEALTFEYWHVELFNPAKRYFIDEIYKGEAWARDVYDPCAKDQSYEYFDAETHCKDGQPVEVPE
jgi:protein tyrosine phosphatase (PTP) superfamily phosphohydrolase (DUF442 family)